MVLTKAWYENLFDSVIRDVVPMTPVNIYKYSSNVNNIYRQDGITYAAAVEAVCIYDPDPDEDRIHFAGKVEEDEAMFTFALPELRSVLSGEAELDWLTTQDIIEVPSFGIKYTIIKVWKTGVLQNGPTTVVIKGKKFPDAITVV